MKGRELFAKLKPLINLLAFILGLLPLAVTDLLLIFLQPFGGKFFALFRYFLLKNKLGACGDNVFFAQNVTLKNYSNIYIGNNVSIHECCYLDGVGGIEIGNDVSIAHHCSMISFEHTWDDASKPIKYNDLLPNKIVINDDVWLGCGVRVLSGVSIGSRSVVAAGAVVTKSFQGNGIVAGVPARFIKNI